jgi:hypothetical protein
MFELGSDLNFGLKLLGQVNMQLGQAQLTDHTFA